MLHRLPQHHLARWAAALALAGLATFSCAAPAGDAAPSGSALWAARCGQCHSFRPPAEYSDAQWDTAVAHMRVAANLPGAEVRAIAAYLRASND